MTKTPTPLVFTYTNWRGETSKRRVIPETFRFAATDWHPEPQWLLVAWDIDKGARRDFAWKDIRLAATPTGGETPGLQEAIGFVQKLHDAYAREFGVYDPSTNATEFSGSAEEVDLTYAEILDGLRDLSTERSSREQGQS